MNSLLVFLMFNYLFVMGCSTFYQKGIRYRKNLFFRLLFINKNSHIPILLFFLQIFNVIASVEIIAFYNKDSTLQMIIDYFIVIEFSIITVTNIFLIIRQEIKEKKFKSYIFLQYVIIFIVIFDIAGALNISLYKNKKYIQTDEIIYETIQYHKMKLNNTDTEYFEIIEKDNKNQYRIEYDQIPYFDDSDFVYKLNAGDQILITYIEKEDYRTVIGLELDGYSFFELSPEEIDNINFAEWRLWYIFSTFPLVISVSILVIKKLRTYRKRRN